MTSATSLRCCLALLATSIRVLATPSTAAESDEASAIRQRIDEYLRAWNAGDTESLREFHDEDYDWMNPVGMHLHGGEVVAAYQTAAFQRKLPPGSSGFLQYDVQSVRFVTDDVAVVDIRYTGTGMGLRPEKPVDAMIVSIYVEKHGKWLRASKRSFVLLRAAKQNAWLQATIARSSSPSPRAGRSDSPHAFRFGRNRPGSAS